MTGMKKNIIKGIISDPIPNTQTIIIRIVWQTVRRIVNEILGVKG